MKGLVYHGPKDLRYDTDVPTPSISHPLEVLIDVHYCGICGTDLKEYSSDVPNFFDPNNGPNKITGLSPPLCMGHEIAGIVTAIGNEVTTVQVGDHVVVDPSVHCADLPRFKDTTPVHQHHKCVQCRRGLTNICDHLSLCGLGATNGGLAETFVTSEAHTIVVPKSIPLEVAALTQPLAVSYHAVRISHFKPGSSALVIGGGAIGLAAILSCFGFKASSVICSEIAELRRKNAEQLGAKGFNPATSKDNVADLLALSPGGHGYDYVFDCTGLEVTLHTALAVCISNGTIVNVAIWGNHPIRFFPMSVTKHEKHLLGSMCYTREDFEGVLAAFDRGDMSIEATKKLITTVVSLENGIEGGFDHLIKNKDTEVKVLITPNNHGEVEYSKTYLNK